MRMEETLKVLGTFLPLFMLSVGACTDLREKSIDIRLILSVGLSGIAIRVLLGDESIPAILAALAPGMILLAGSLASSGGIGTGDGLSLMVLGLFYPPEKVWTILFAALCIGGAEGAFLLLRGRGRGYSFPFLPCLLAGCLCWEVMRMIHGQ